MKKYTKIHKFYNAYFNVTAYFYLFYTKHVFQSILRFFRDTFSLLHSDTYLYRVHSKIIFIWGGG